MTAISAKEMESMRKIADDFLPDTCTIQTKTESVGAMGGVSHSFANTYTSVPCRVDPAGAARGNEFINNLALQGQSAWMLNVPYTQAIDIEDRVVHDSVTYEVSQVWDTHSYKTIRRAVMVRVD